MHKSPLAGTLPMSLFQALRATTTRLLPMLLVTLQMHMSSKSPRALASFCPSPSALCTPLPGVRPSPSSDTNQLQQQSLPGTQPCHTQPVTSAASPALMTSACQHPTPAALPQTLTQASSVSSALLACLTAARIRDDSYMAGDSCSGMHKAGVFCTPMLHVSCGTPYMLMLSSRSI